MGFRISQTFNLKKKLVHRKQIFIEKNITSPSDPQPSNTAMPVPSRNVPDKNISPVASCQHRPQYMHHMYEGMDFEM